MTTERRAVIADHYQFYLQDVEAHDQAMRAGYATDPANPAGGWTDEAVSDHRIGLEPHSISVGTARPDLVETVFDIYPLAPQQEPKAEHIVEADLEVRTGAIRVLGCTEAPSDDRRIEIDPGLYRARISYVPIEPPSQDTADDGLGGHFRYCIDIWPSPGAAPVAVLRQGPSSWAG